MQSNSTGAVAVDFSSTPARNQTRITSITIPGKNPYHLSQSDKLCDFYNRFKKALCFAVKKEDRKIDFFFTTRYYHIIYCRPYSFDSISSLYSIVVTRKFFESL